MEDEMKIDNRGGFGLWAIELAKQIVGEQGYDLARASRDGTDDDVRHSSPPEQSCTRVLVRRQPEIRGALQNMADAILLNADELARENTRHAGQVLNKAQNLIRQFDTLHPHRIQSYARH